MKDQINRKTSNNSRNTSIDKTFIQSKQFTVNPERPTSPVRKGIEKMCPSEENSSNSYSEFQTQKIKSNENKFEELPFDEGYGELQEQISQMQDILDNQGQSTKSKVNKLYEKIECLTERNEKQRLEKRDLRNSFVRSLVSGEGLRQELVGIEEDYCEMKVKLKATTISNGMLTTQIKDLQEELTLQETLVRKNKIDQRVIQIENQELTADNEKKKTEIEYLKIVLDHKNSEIREKIVGLTENQGFFFQLTQNVNKNLTKFDDQIQVSGKSLSQLDYTLETFESKFDSIQAKNFDKINIFYNLLVNKQKQIESKVEELIKQNSTLYFDEVKKCIDKYWSLNFEVNKKEAEIRGSLKISNAQQSATDKKLEEIGTALTIKEVWIQCLTQNSGIIGFFLGMMVMLFFVTFIDNQRYQYRR